MMSHSLLSITVAFEFILRDNVTLCCLTLTYPSPYYAPEVVEDVGIRKDIERHILPPPI